MPSKSSGRIVKPQRQKKLTHHQKNHRWESFSSKISKLHSLDPLRKVRRHDLDAEDLSSTTSYLRNGLEKWAELNLSRHYAAFKSEIVPLTMSLPQIFHFEETIMGLLERYIQLQDRESLEPLLDLLTAFAHDLGPRFEKHYPKALGLLVATATGAGAGDVEVLEWTFAALAFLFKYLARLLVSDMRPTYDVVAPLMGGPGASGSVPGHVARFAAEALSFLVKKAAAPIQRDTALPLIVAHARDTLRAAAGTRHVVLYSQGIMTMFAEAIKGPGNGLHSTASDTFLALLRAVPDEELLPGEQTMWSNVCCGVTTSIIHHTTAETFGAIEMAIVQEAVAAAETDTLARNPGRMMFFTRLFGTMAGVRKASRLRNWGPLMKALCKVLGTFAAVEHGFLDMASAHIWDHVLVNTALACSQAPLDALIPCISSLAASLTKEPLMRWYIPFCSLFADFNPQRFRSLFQKDFQRFIVSHWSDGANEDMLCVFLPRMVKEGLPPSGDKDSLMLPQSWQDQIVSKFIRLEDSPFPERGVYGKDAETWRDKCLPKYSSLLRVMESTTVHASTKARIAEVLLKKLKLALRPTETLPTDEELFIVSHGFRAYLGMSMAAGSLDASLGPLLKDKARRFRLSVGFLQSLLAYEQVPKKLPDKRSESPLEEPRLVKSLVSNLSSASHDVRLLSLQILHVLDEAPDHSSVLATMLQLEQTPLELPNTRTMAVHLRQLGQVYADLPEGSWLRQAVPAFLFGMLTVPLSPVWDDAVEAMTHVARSKTGEEQIANLVFDWLREPSDRHDGRGRPIDQRHPPLSDFDCLNLMRLQNTARETGRIVHQTSEVMLETFEEGQQLIPERPERARGKALKVLGAMPGLAEKRARTSVPFLLSWTDEQDTFSGSEDDQDAPMSLGEGTWSLQDRKALVAVFAKFNNPRALYQSSRVYDSLLNLLANGDIELQKSALKAILAWKQDGVKPYQEHLQYLLDEARFKDELTVFFQGDNRMQPKHRAEAMPILLRLLYGRSISKKGAASGRQGLHATRLAVIRHLSVEDMGDFLDIALGKLRDVRVVDGSGLREAVFVREMMPPRNQVGVLNMVESVISELGSGVLAYMEVLVNSVLYCLISSCRRLQAADEVEEKEVVTNTSLHRVVRTTALKCLCKLFQNVPTFDWTAYQDVIVAEMISPRIEKLPLETTQGVSATWKLLCTWSALPRAALMLAIDDRIVPKIAECLAVEKAKDEVKTFALNTIRNIIRLARAPAAESEFNELIKAKLLDAHMQVILERIGSLLHAKAEMGRELLATAVETVVELSPMVEKSTNVQELMEISAYLLNQPSRKVNPKIKGSILVIMKQFIVLGDMQATANLKRRVYDTLAALFSFFKDTQNRQTLSTVLDAYASQEPSVQEVARLCSDLNSFLPNRLDEPDYDRRMKAFNVISGTRDTPFTLEQWMPLLHNLVYYLPQDEEFGVLSTNAADGLCKFVEAVEAAWAGPDQDRYTEVLSTVVLPAIYAGARHASETARREHLRLLGFLAAHLPQWPPVSDLGPLVRSDKHDESFFFHVLSPAVSRQMQVLQMLEQANAAAPLHSKNVSQFFIPLLEHFIFDRAGGDDKGLAARATDVIGSLALALDWQQYRAILRRFVSYVESRPEKQKQVIRLLEKTVDSLALAVRQRPRRRRLATTLPDQEKMATEVTVGFLPPLLRYLHDRDDTTIGARVPVGVIIVKLIKLLPRDQLGEKLPGPLIDICHMLRSKTWEAREMARDTLAKIAVVLGPEGFDFLLKELRGALTRGYQLHVLSYTLHAILLAVMPVFGHGELDQCLSSIMAVIMDDIFGVTGDEKDAEDYASKTREVKSSKSQDSMELVVKKASIGHLRVLVQPLQSMLMQKLDLRTVRKVDELLARVTSGLLQNPGAESRDTLVFCYEVMRGVYDAKKPDAVPHVDPKLRKYLIQKGAKKSGERETTNTHTYKVLRFAIDMVRAVMKKFDSLRTAANMTGFLPVLGDAVVSADEEVKIAAFKIMQVLVKVPHQTAEWTNLYKVASKEAIRDFSQASTTATEVAQSALKLLAVLLRDRPDVAVKDAAVDMLLGKVKDDLTEPLYRHVTFNFLRSVLDRKVETATVYDTLDHVGTVMITNDDKDTRDLARGAFFQFLREYPQKQARWAKQLAFVVANLQYEREGGRLSAMEVVHLLLRKTAEDYAQEVATTCFLPLVFVLVNDESDRCRRAAGELVKEIFRVADAEKTASFLTLLRKWLQQHDNAAVTRLAVQAFTFYFESRDPNDRDKKDMGTLLKKCAQILGEAQDWELVNDTLGAVQVAVEKHAEWALGANREALWAGVRQCLGHARPDVQLTAAKLLATYLGDFGKAKDAENGYAGSHGLRLGPEAIQQLARLSLGMMAKAEDEALARETVKLLVTLGGYLDASTADEDESESEDEAEAEPDAETEGSPNMTIRYLFRKLSATVRRETSVRAAALVPKLAAMDVLLTLCSAAAAVPVPTLRSCAATFVLAPMRHLTDPSVPAPVSRDEAFLARHEALRERAQAVLEALQARLGNAAYSAAMVEVGRRVRDIRTARKAKRSVAAVADPERWGREKRRKTEKKKDRRKVRGREMGEFRRGKGAI